MPRLILWTFALCVLTTVANAQPYSSDGGLFTISQKGGCIGISITVNAPMCYDDPSDDPIKPAGCNIDFGDGSGPVTIPPQTGTIAHTYSQAGTFTVMFVSGGGGVTDKVTVNIYPDTQPQFQIAQCTGNSVRVKILENVYTTYRIDYGDLTAPVNVSGNGSNTHAYSPGSHTVTVTGIHQYGSVSDCTPSNQQVNVTAIVDPFINRLEVVNNSSIELQYNATANVQYGIQLVPSNQQVKTIVYPSNSTTMGVETINNLRTDDTYFCFRVLAYDACSNSPVGTGSNVICSSDFDLSVLDGKNQLSWTTNPSGVSSYQISKETVSTSSTVTFTVAGTPYNDTDVQCGKEYCYTQLTNYSNGSQSISLKKCGFAFSTATPDVIENIWTDLVTLQEVSLGWQEPTAFVPAQYKIFKQNGSAFPQLTTVTSPSYVDISDQATCYQISYTDVCGNESSRSRVVCPIVLTAEVSEQNHILLNWTKYNGYDDGVAEYIIEKYDDEGNLLETISVVPTSSTYEDKTENLFEQTYRYIVRARPVDGTLIASNSNTVIIIKNPHLFHPSAFTPNGDNLNDTFRVFGQYIDKFEMNIFNRWGELIFTTWDLDNEWDGTYKGTPMPEGTYTFIAHITDLAGRTSKTSGSIVLLKKPRQ